MLLHSGSIVLQRLRCRVLISGLKEEVLLLPALHHQNLQWTRTQIQSMLCFFRRDVTLWLHSTRKPSHPHIKPTAKCGHALCVFQDVGQYSSSSRIKLIVKKYQVLFLLTDIFSPSVLSVGLWQNNHLHQQPAHHPSTGEEA